jgi:hypothetical protein
MRLDGYSDSPADFCIEVSSKGDWRLLTTSVIARFYWHASVIINGDGNGPASVFSSLHLTFVSGTSFGLNIQCRSTLLSFIKGQ